VKHFKEIVTAKTPEDAVRLRREAGIRALYLAGGTMTVPLAARAIDLLVDIGRLDLGRVATRDGVVSIGATARMCDLLTPDLEADLPLVSDALRQCATPLVRNMATAGGALAVVHLPSDFALAVLAADGVVEILREERVKVAASDLLAKGWLKGADLVLGIEVPTKAPREGTGFEKFGRSAVDIAIVSAAVRVVRAADGSVGDLRIAVGQSNSLPVLLKDACAAAVGKPLTKDAIAEISRSAASSIKARSDFRASAEYRKHLVEVFVGRALVRAGAKAGWNL